jgi:hypothetical protein
MRTRIGGTFLALFTLAGLGFVLAGRGHPSHAGPCLSGSCPAPKPSAEPRRLPFVTFAEPPYAEVIPAGLTVPADAPD